MKVKVVLRKRAWNYLGRGGQMLRSPARRWQRTVPRKDCSDAVRELVSRAGLGWNEAEALLDISSKSVAGYRIYYYETRRIR